MALKLVKQESNINKSNILEGLNPQQQKATKVIDGPLLIIAGAGSGKTRVLTHRIAYLIENQIPAHQILALTFTNKAAREMKERISKIVSSDSIKDIWAGTFHSIFARILRYEAENIGFNSAFSIYDTDDSLRMIKRILRSLGIDPKQFSPQGMRSRISWAKNQMIDWSEYSDSAETMLQKQTALVFEEYEKELIKNNAMDFDNLLINMIQLLKSDKSILNKYQDKFKYILVDEYQDTNKAQYEAINLLAKKNKNICVVGDDAQSIYRWRGADIRNILEFKKDYNNTSVIRLEQNYRSTKVILSAADSVIKNNRKQLQKKLWTDNPDGDLIEILSNIDEKYEAETIAEKINQNKNEFDLKDFAILYRTNAQSLALENAMRKYHLPYVIIGGTSFYKRKEIKDALSYLKLLFNPMDTESLLRIINEPPRGIGQTTLRHVRNYAIENDLTLFEALNQAKNIFDLQQRAVNSITTFLNFLNTNIQAKEELPSSELSIKFIEETGLLQMYKEINTNESYDRWNNLQQLLSDISTFFRNEENANLEDYLQQISLITDIDEKNTHQNNIKLMTLHAAKGLEFPVVFITGMEKGLFPLSKAESDPEEEEEERRLFYVGITRAEQKLFLSYAQRRMKYGEYSNQIPSQFIDEINPELLKKANSSYVHKKSTKKENKIINNFNKEKKIIQPTSKNNTYSHNADTNLNINFKSGDQVHHNKFGKGKIMAVAGSGSNIKAVVNFKSVGKKVLMLQYAKLEKV